MTLLGDRTTLTTTARLEPNAFEHDEPTPQRVPMWLRDGWPVAFGAAVGSGLFWLARPALSDDAYISMSFARNLAEHGEWALVTGIPANTATSALNALLLALGTLVTGSAVVAVAALLAVCLGAVAAWTRHLAGPGAAIAAVLMLAGAPVLNSAVGLETFLVAALSLGVVRFAAPGRWIVAGVAAGLLVLARPDAAVLGGVALLVCTPRRAVAAGGVAAAVVAPYLAWSWWVFGDLVPRTMAVKSVIAEEYRRTALDGWSFYLAHYPAASAITVAVIVSGIAALGAAISQADRPSMALGAGGLAHLGVIIVLDTGAVYYYLAPGVAALGLCAVLVAARQTGWRVPVAALIVAGLAVMAARGLPWDDGRAPFRANLATTGEYMAVASVLPPGTVLSTASPSMDSRGEIGVLAYFAPPRTRVVEFLSDPGRTAPYVQRWQATHPMLAWLYSDSAPAPLPVNAQIVLDPEPRGPWPASATGVGRTMRVEPVP